MISPEQPGPGSAKVGTAAYAQIQSARKQVARAAAKRQEDTGVGTLNDSTDLNQQHPLGHCVFCAAKTPHVHERYARNGQQHARSMCLACNQEQPRATKESA
jgi:hypothetical protein